MSKKKLVQPPQNGHNGVRPEGLALNNAGVNELAQFLGCSNWFAGELVRHGILPHAMMGERNVVARKDAENWLREYFRSEAYQTAIAKWLKDHPGEKAQMPPFTTETEAAFEKRFKEIQQLSDELTAAQTHGDTEEIKRVKAKFEASGVEVADESFIRRLMDKS